MRAFSCSIESSKAFELAIRKPRRKLKHKIVRLRGWIYSIYLLLTKHHGKPPSTTQLTQFFVAFAAVLSLDIMLLVNFSFHIFLPVTNFNKFGWVFFFVYFLVPYLSPLLAIASAIKGSDFLLKQVGNMNSLVIMVNIPLTAFAAIYNDDDPYWLLNLVLMIFVKVLLSAVSAKVCQNLINPRYSKNQDKLVKILNRQKDKLQKRNEILGEETAKQLDGIAPSEDADEGTVLPSGLNTRRLFNTHLLRDKLLE